jgi:hypothetical protein
VATWSGPSLEAGEEESGRRGLPIWRRLCIQVVRGTGEGPEGLIPLGLRGLEPRSSVHFGSCSNTLTGAYGVRCLDRGGVSVACRVDHAG